MTCTRVPSWITFFLLIFLHHRGHSAAAPQPKTISHRGHRDHRATNRVLIYSLSPVPGGEGRVRGRSQRKMKPEIRKPKSETNPKIIFPKLLFG
jgi:hypothetical protein